jgi:hypothetical protein
MVLAGVLGLAACSSETTGTAKVSFTLKSVVQGVKAAPVLVPAARSAAFYKANLAPNQIAGVSFTPTQVFVPITRIALVGRTYEIRGGEKVLIENEGSVDVYTCPGPTPAECKVEISSPADLAALSDKLRNVAVPEGVYRLISVYNGFGGGSAFVKGALEAKGSFALAGVTYYTSPGGPVTAAADAGLVSLEISNGGWDFPLVANGTLTVSEGQSVAVALFANYDALLFGQQISDLAVSEGNGCVVEAGGQLGICGTNPAIVGYIGAASPLIEAYELTFSGSGWYDNMTALWLFVVDPASNSVIGILPKQYLVGAVGGKTGNFFGAMESFTVNADGSLSFGRGTLGDPGYFTVSGFRRADHEGTITLEANGEGHYVARKL